MKSFPISNSRLLIIVNIILGLGLITRLYWSYQVDRRNRKLIHRYVRKKENITYPFVENEVRQISEKKKYLSIFLEELARCRNEKDFSHNLGFKPKLARAILFFRERHGNPNSLKDLSSIQGFNANKIASILDKIKTGELPRRTINLNLATEKQLLSLPGIGPSIAKRIIEYRSIKGPFTFPADLTKVKGISKKLLKKVEPYIRLWD
ncbi:helix-hairpin-helix domain-containing protein [Candidatus Riflebacteria bacterium]